MDQEVYVCPIIVDYDSLFETDPDAHALICDNTTSKNQMKEQLQQLCLDGSKDLNFVASCECGKLFGNYWDQAEGKICKYCHTRCETNFAKRLKFRAWLEIPPYAPPVIHPKIYSILNKWMGKIAKVPIMEYLLNPEIELPPILAGRVGQGARYFYENFDNIINFFLTQFQPLQIAAARKRAKGIPELLNIYKGKIFVRHIPILNQELHLMTKSGTMMYGDDCLQSILKARIELGMLQQVYNSGVVSNHHVDSRLFEFLMAIVEYDDLIDSVKMLGKTGQIRKLILGARFHCSIRGVISPLFGPQKIDELHLPWKGAVILYKLEILNILVKRMGYTVPDALKIYEHAENSYDKTVDDIFKILIKECQELTGLPGMPMTFGRNPTLDLGSIYLLFVTHIKPDVNDTTISISDLTHVSPNFDFDGDAMSGVSLKTLNLVKDFMKIHPSVCLLNGKIGISSALQLTLGSVLAVNCWLNEESGIFENLKKA